VRRQRRKRPANNPAAPRRRPHRLPWWLVILVLASGCGRPDEMASSPSISTASPSSLSQCVEARADLLPYSFCLPTGWTVEDVAHMDGSVDIVMMDESGEAFGFGKAMGPIEPSGRLNPYKRCPENLLDPERQKRLAAAVGGVEPSSIEEVSIQQLSVDGNPACLLTLTIDAGLWKRRRVDIGGDASIELFFAFDPSSLNDEVLRDIVSTVHLDASLIDQALQQAADGGASS
jgi:hypothetical protein